MEEFRNLSENFKVDIKFVNGIKLYNLNEFM